MAKVPLKSVHPDALVALREIGQAIRRARVARGETQSDAAEKIGAHVQTVGRIEKGEPGVTSGHLLSLLALYGRTPQLMALAADDAVPPPPDNAAP